jgi:hypothetical protein
LAAFACVSSTFRWFSWVKSWGGIQTSLKV